MPLLAVLTGKATLLHTKIDGRNGLLMTGITIPLGKGFQGVHRTLTITRSIGAQGETAVVLSLPEAPADHQKTLSRTSTAQSEQRITVKRSEADSETGTTASVGIPYPATSIQFQELMSIKCNRLANGRVVIEADRLDINIARRRSTTSSSDTPAQATTSSEPVTSADPVSKPSEERQSG